MLLPWSHRTERAASLHSAAAEKEHSLRNADAATKLEQQIRRLAAENHFAETLAAQIITRHRGKDAG